MDKCKQALKEDWQYVYSAKGIILSRAQIDAVKVYYKTPQEIIRSQGYHQAHNQRKYAVSVDVNLRNL